MEIKEEKQLNRKLYSGVFWKFFERFAAQGVSLIVSIILARLLSPSDYSVVSIVLIFFAFANVIISGGLNTALIQKKNADIEDYSTVLHISVILSILVYIGLFIAAPYIARLFNQTILTLVIRIMSISLPITAIKSVWCAYISSHMQFKKFFFSTLGGTLISAVVGILMAVKGFGAWALVAQQMTNTIIDTLILIIVTRLKIVPRINFKKFKELFSYGWKILLSSLLNVSYVEITPFIIGIRFSSESLSYYTKGRTFPNTINTMTTSTLSSVLFPFLSKHQDNKEKILFYTRRYIQIASFIVFPMMLGLFAVSDNFVYVVLTSKWMEASYYIKVFCIACMFDVIAIGNCETIKAIGRSGVFLAMEIIKKSSYFITILLFVLFSRSPKILAISSIVCMLVQIVVNSIPNKRIIGYRFRDQAADLVPSLIASSIMCAVVLLLQYLSNGFSAITLIKQIVVGIATYFLVVVITKNKAFNLLKSFFIRK